MLYEFRWDDWNVNHIAEHGVSIAQAEFVVSNAKPPYPREIGDEKWLVWGQDINGMYLQVIYIFDPIDVVYVIHARPVTERERRRFRRKRR